MSDYRLSQLLDMSLVQKLADSNFRASGIPLSIIDVQDNAILARAGWTDICMNFHRACPASHDRCTESDGSIKNRLVEGEAYRYKCLNGLWHVAIPIMVAKKHLATMFLTQFYFEGEVPEREYFIRQGREFGYDQDAYLAALDKLPVFSADKVNYIIAYDKALVHFISGLAEQSLKIMETKTLLAESEEKVRMLLTSINIGVFQTTAEGRFLQANPAMAKIFGHQTPELFMQQSVIELYQHREDRTLFLEMLKSKQTVKDMELRMKKRDGTSIWTSLSATAQYDEQGAIKHVNAVLEDITERMQAREALQRMNEELELRVKERTAQLETTNLELKSASEHLDTAYRELKSAQSHILQQEKMASIGQLAAGIAHEINNPIGFLTSNLNTLMRYAEKINAYGDLVSTTAEKIASGPAGDSTELIEQIRKGKASMRIDAIMSDLTHLIRESLEGADRVKTIVQNLKDFSRVDQAELQFMDVNECLASTIEMVGPELIKKAALKKELGMVPKTYCNPGQLNQVFSNLLQNAAQSIEHYGEIAIKTWLDNGDIKIAIHDTGRGIPSENLQRIFEPFFTTKEVGKGTGLGLSIAYDIVKNHGGVISVQSEVGKGTTVTVALPVREAR
jgi:PAS domain S-box-containing protein